MFAICDVLILSAVAVAPQAWLDRGLNSENSEPSRTYTVPLADEKDALAEADELKQEAALRKKIAEKMVIRGLEDKCR